MQLSKEDLTLISIALIALEVSDQTMIKMFDDVGPEIASAEDLDDHGILHAHAKQLHQKRIDTARELRVRIIQERVKP